MQVVWRREEVILGVVCSKTQESCLGEGYLGSVVWAETLQGLVRRRGIEYAVLYCNSYTLAYQCCDMLCVDIMRLMTIAM